MRNVVLQDDPRSDLQRAEALHGDEPEAVRRLHAAVQDGAAKVSVQRLARNSVRVALLLGKNLVSRLDQIQWRPLVCYSRVELEVPNVKQCHNSRKLVGNIVPVPTAKTRGCPWVFASCAE